MGKGETSQSSTSEPLPEQYDRLRGNLGGLPEGIWGEADRLYQDAKQYFPGSTVGQRDQASGTARSLTAGLSDVDYTNDARDFMGQTLRGEFMGGPGQNPMLDERFAQMSGRIGEQYNRIVAPGTSSRYAGAGRINSAAYRKSVDQDQVGLGRALGETATNVYYADYENRMDDRMSALGLTPGMRAVEHADINQNRQQGGIEEGYYQRLLNDSISRFNFNQNEPEGRLDRYQSRIMNPGGMGTTTSSMTSPDNTLLSLGLGLFGLGGSLGGGWLAGRNN